MRRVEELQKLGLMKPAGLEAYEARRENRSGIYSYEQREAEMVAPYDGLMKKNKAAWAFWEAQPPGYRKVITWWVMSAKKEETRLHRLAKLIDACEKGIRLR
jgi:uncharacterized protein YdeI (YjbR/CyaY-like superfamily)